MRVLSVRQPWASAIVGAIGGKNVENRSWRTDYRGPLAIHASSKDGGPAAWRDLVRRVGNGVAVPTLPYGALIGVVDLVEIVPAVVAYASNEHRRWVDRGHGVWCWILANPRSLERPIAMTGQLGLWEIDDQLLRPLANANTKSPTTSAICAAVTPGN